MVGAFFVPVVVLVCANTVVFSLVMRSLLTSGRSVTSTNMTRGLEQARRGIAISTFLGLTWVSGVLAVREAKMVFQYIFCITNSLQGCMIFLFYCALSTEIRSKYRKWLTRRRSKLARSEIGTSLTSVAATTVRRDPFEKD